MPERSQARPECVASTLTQELARESLEHYRLLLTHAPIGIVLLAEGRIVFANPASARIAHVNSSQDLEGRALTDFLAPDRQSASLDRIERLLAGDTGLYPREELYVRTDGSTVPVEIVAVPLTYLGKPAVQLVIADITERKRLEQALQHKTDELERFFSEALDLLCIISTDGRFRRLNRQWEQTLGYTNAELDGTPCIDLVHPDDVDAVKTALTAFQTSRVTRCFTSRWRSRDGSYRWLEWRCRHDGEDVFAAARDVTEALQAEEALRKSELLLLESQSAAGVGSWEVDFVADRVTWSAEMYRIFGISPESFLGDTASFLRLIHPDDVGAMRRWLQALGAGGNPPETEFRAVLPDGAARLIQGRGALISSGSGGHERAVGTALDVTERKRSEQERSELQAQLQLAQKMEAVGRLAGGVAHDFNNLLSVILNYAAFSIQSLRQGDPLREDLGEIQKAATRAAALTRQLLAFSRKQVLKPEVLDLGRVAADLEKMLLRVIGEDISLVLVLAPKLKPVKVDPGQIEQVIMNLVVNARDAMPGGGRLTIETANVDLDTRYTARRLEVNPGPYVMLAFTDTGCGMNATVQEHLFEPFFTTKEKGKGTGLGLSTVYGIIKQSGGHVRVYSEPGRGTTFKIYLPQVAEASASATTLPPQRLSVGTETILLVEDEEAVRKLTSRILRAAGFRVLVASHGGEALIQCETFPSEIDLLLTDVVMPQMSGHQLAQRLLRIRPALKVLYMSGYAENAIVHQGVLDPDTKFISKPFGAVELTKKVREVLDNQSVTGG